jgi:antitoxin HicB
MIAADPVIALKLALAQAMREQGTRKAALARRLGTDEKEVRRLLDPDHAAKARRLAEALRALGHSVEVAVTWPSRTVSPARRRSLRAGP